MSVLADWEIYDSIPNEGLKDLFDNLSSTSNIPIINYFAIFKKNCSQKDCVFIYDDIDIFCISMYV